MPSPLLDQYLALGWFRMGQGIFTTQFLYFDKTYYSALWLRINLEKSEVKPIKSKFDVEITNFNNSLEKEQLFSKYKTGITFETSKSLEKLLLASRKQDIFTTFEITIRDAGKLIGVGIFDTGATSAEGIVCFYDPEYKKYSLGKYLIQYKIEYLRNQGFTYFYPGYFAPNYSRFDYKLNFDKKNLEYFDLKDNSWIPIAEFEPNKTPIKVIEDKLKLLMANLETKKVHFKLMHYSYFDIGMAKGFMNQHLLEAPKFIFCFYDFMGQFGIIIFDYLKNTYQLLLCSKVYDVNKFEPDDMIFNEFIIKPITILAENENLEIFVHQAQKLLLKI